MKGRSSAIKSDGESYKLLSVEAGYKFLANMSLELSTLRTENEVFGFLGIKLSGLFPKTLISINQTNSNGTYLKVKRILGLEKSFFLKIISALGFDPIGKMFKLNDTFKARFSEPKLKLFEGSFYEFSNYEISQPIAQLIEKVLDIKCIYNIGIAGQDQSFGYIHFFTSGKDAFIDSSLLESFVYLCYLTIARIKSVKDLEESEKQYKLLAENVKDVIFTLDLKLNYTYISSSIMNLRGYEPSQLIGQSIMNSLSPDSLDKVRNLFVEAFKAIKKGGDESFREHLIEIELVHRDGHKIWTEVKASFIYDNHNKAIGILGVTRDINDRKLAEKELLKKNIELNKANAQKDKFFSIIAHDLKNPFGHILNFTSLLKDHYNLYSDKKRIQFIELINKSTQQIYLLLENLLDWSRSQGGKMDFFPQKLKLDAIVTNIIDLMENSAASKKITFKKKISLKTSVWADEYMLKTILRNLIGNAIKFTQEGGNVTIGCSSDKSHLTIMVSDNGIGMDADLTNALFSLDNNTSKTGTQGEKGTGLGLLLCKEFVGLHGGHLWVESILGKGSTFYFSVPINK